MTQGASLSRRLLLAASAFIAIAIVIAAIIIGFALHRFVQGQIDQRLDTQIVFLASMLRIDSAGRLTLTGSADGPPFERRRHGWYWQVSGPANVLRSESLEGSTLELPDGRDIRPPPPPPREERAKKDRPLPGDGSGPDGEGLHFRIKQVAVSGTQVTIIATSPRGAVLGPLREAMTTLAISLVALALTLIIAMLLQIRLGLRPLKRLRQSVADVRSGRSDFITDPQPREIAPLAAELNALLAQNATNLDRARRHVANLAHGLKTPLATLSIALAPGTLRGSDDLRSLVQVMDRRIRHHLGRARAAALSGPVRTQTPIAPRLRDLGEALAKIHGDKTVTLTVAVGDDVAVACEQQDFDEMAGNLLENAFKWTRSRISIRAEPDGARICRLTIDDDGPGLQASQRMLALRPGERLDESMAGFGFGLPITRELAELYGGQLDLSASDLGGLRVELKLPIPVN